MDQYKELPNLDQYEDLPNFPLILKKVNRKRNLVRLMSKSGSLNFQLSRVPSSKYLRFTKDFANTLVVIRWRWVIAVVFLANLFFYLCFSGLFMFDAWFSGDHDPSKTGNFCIAATRQFSGYFLLSIETITTTGYGYLYPTENCKISWFILILNTIVIVLMDGMFISVVFLKIGKPPKKDALTLFSRKCVISLRNGKLCLVFRINDMLERHVISSSVSVYFIDRSDSELILHELETTFSGMLLWPSDIVHEIDEESPFWKVSAKTLMEKKFEIFVTVTGGSVTNQFSSSQTSYTNEEIMWGFRFKSCMKFDDKFQRYVITDNDLFKVEPCDTPLCNASKLREIRNEITKVIYDAK